MPITPAQKMRADSQQSNAATDTAPQVRLVAGPGTGKSSTIIKRVHHLLSIGANPSNLYVISFTRATCAELESRIIADCAGTPLAAASVRVRVSTMHSLALRILKRANLLRQYPSDPTILDDWEQSNIYDSELSYAASCTPTRAAEIRLAHDARWQTLNTAMISQAQITPAEITAFNSFHASRTNLYSCVLPGEVVFKCVEAFTSGSVQLSQLPSIQHLIVDEFQDLNACDQEFVRILTSGGATLFVAGDDDQSIYSFRHADPSGIIQFQQRYPSATTHTLTDCFRCTPAILNPASTLISFNPFRLDKNLDPLYLSAVPPVIGKLEVWSFQNADDEARAIAKSCHELIAAGMNGHEDEIIILISNRRLQLDLISRELGNLGLPFDPPNAESLIEDKMVRAVYSILRLCREHENQSQDYMAYRTMLAKLSGVGLVTVKKISDDCIRNNQNFRRLFDLNPLPNWLNARSKSAISKVAEIANIARDWTLADTILSRTNEINALLTTYALPSRQFQTVAALWYAISTQLPQQMNLGELIQFLETENESDQQLIINKVNSRLGVAQQTVTQAQMKIRILTMHGAKGLSGKVVFIPSCEQEVLPSARALQAAGLVIEQRRLFYVSLTRANAACFLSHASVHTGSQAFLLQQRSTVRLTRSQFLNELGVASVNRVDGLSHQEAQSVISDINNL